MVATSRHQIGWAYFAQILNLTSGILLLPFILHYLTQVEVGLWFVFASLAGIAQLLELGFQTTISRNITYAYNGALLLAKSGMPSFQESASNRPLVANLIKASRLIYFLIGTATAALLIIGGSFYLSTFQEVKKHTDNIQLAWIIFALGQTLTFYFNYFNCALIGRGNVTEANKIVALTRASFVVIAIVLLYSQWALIGLGLASLVSCVIGRVLAGYYFQKIVQPDVTGQPESYPKLYLINILWFNAYRLGLTQLGAYLALRASLLIVSSYLGLAEAARYGLTMSLLSALSGIAGAIGQVQLPRMNALQAQGDLSKLRETFGSVLVLSWSIYLIGLVVLLLFGTWGLKTIGSRTELIPMFALIVLSVIMFLELNHSLAALYLTTTNHVAFANAAMISSLSIVFINLLLINQIGIWALVISQGFVQLLYNNWKWPVEALRHLQVRPKNLLLEGFLELKRLLRDSRHFEFQKK